MSIPIVKAKISKQSNILNRWRFRAYFLFLLLCLINSFTLGTHPTDLFMFFMAFLITYEVVSAIFLNKEHRYFCSQCDNEITEIRQPCAKCHAIVVNNPEIIKKVRDISEWKKYNQIIAVGLIIAGIVLILLISKLVYTSWPHNYKAQETFSDHIAVLVERKNAKINPQIMKLSSFLKSSQKQDISLYHSLSDENNSNNYTGTLKWQVKIINSNSQIIKYTHQTNYYGLPEKQEVYYQLTKNRIIPIYSNQDFDKLFWAKSIWILLVFVLITFYGTFFILFGGYRLYRFFGSSYVK